MAQRVLWNDGLGVNIQDLNLLPSVKMRINVSHYLKMVNVTYSRYIGTDQGIAQLKIHLEITGEIVTDVNQATPWHYHRKLSLCYPSGCMMCMIMVHWKTYKRSGLDLKMMILQHASSIWFISEQASRAFQNEDGEWIGIAFDSADRIINKAKESGFDLTIDIDTSANGVVSDFEGDIGTPTGSLATVTPDYVGEQVYLNAKNGEVCHDMILGAYTMTPARSELTTFLPPYQSIYLTVISQSKYGVQSIADTNADGTEVYLWSRSYAYDTVGPMVESWLHKQ